MTVYSPAEDSYLLKDALPEEMEGLRALDMGTGSGFLAVEMAERGADVLAADINPEAVQEAAERAESNGLDIETVRSDLFDSVDGKFDLIVFNPPYLPGDEGVGDEEIWRGGENGVELTEKFLEQLDDYLNEGGEAFIVVSSRAETDALEKYDLETVEEEELWFETLRVVRYG